MAEKIININDYRAASRHKYAKKPDVSRVDYMRKLREEAKENSFMQQMVNLFKTQTKALGKAKIGKQTVAQRANGFVHGAQMTTAALAKDLGFDKMFRKLQHKSKPALARGKQMMNNVRKNLTLDAKAANLDKAPGEIQKFNKGFAHGFAAFLKDPKASIRQASGHVQHAFAQVGQKIKNAPSFLVAAPAAYHKALDKFDERKIILNLAKSISKVFHLSQILKVDFTLLLIKILKYQLVALMDEASSICTWLRVSIRQQLFHKGVRQCKL